MPGLELFSFLTKMAVDAEGHEYPFVRSGSKVHGIRPDLYRGRSRPIFARVSQHVSSPNDGNMGIR